GDCISGCWCLCYGVGLILNVSGRMSEARYFGGCFKVVIINDFYIFNIREVFVGFVFHYSFGQVCLNDLEFS
ncbi:hypothetical protein ACQWFV_24970, partial [Salmonella enterica subsp. enterica serovar Infantis]